MGLISLASSRSSWLGYEYYKDKKVKSHKQTNENEYEGNVQSNGKKLQV